MILLFISNEDSSRRWRVALSKALPELEFRFWPDEIGDPSEIDYVLAWKPPKGEMKRYPNLKAILSLGAGIDHLAEDPELPSHIPVSRLVDRCLTQGMTEYNVAGWSRTPKDIPSVLSFHGPESLRPFLNRTDILICLLPMTTETHGIINKKNLAQLPKGAVVINCARGAHVVDDDLIEALDSEHISSVVLDVFHTEPLPSDHPFWGHPKIIITPHMASLTVAHSAADYVAENIRRVERGDLPLNTVDFSLGY